MIDIEKFISFDRFFYLSLSHAGCPIPVPVFASRGPFCRLSPLSDPQSKPPSPVLDSSARRLLLLRIYVRFSCRHLPRRGSRSLFTSDDGNGNPSGAEELS